MTGGHVALTTLMRRYCLRGHGDGRCARMVIPLAQETDCAALCRADTPRHLELRALALELIDAGLAAADPAQGLSSAVSFDRGLLTVAGRTYDLSSYDRVLIVGAGKATATLAVRLEQMLGERLTGGLVVLRPEDSPAGLSRVAARRADHPVPSHASARAGAELLELARGLGTRDLVIALFTGGSSSLASLAPDSVPIAAKRRLHELLLASGARIQDVNAVRKSVSAIKGGRLAAAGRLATWVNISVSDVVGDELTYITDLTVADPDGPGRARDVLVGLGLWDRVDPSIRAHLLSRPDPADLRGVDIHSVIVASGATALVGMMGAAARLGLTPISLGCAVEGEAAVLAGRFANEVARHAPSTPAAPVALLAAGGEATVALGAGAGLGGPNQELALAFARLIEAQPGVVGAFVDSDGLDGSTRHAGGVVDAGTTARARAGGADVARLLTSHSSTSALRAAGDLVTTGATGTNVNDLAVVVVDPHRPGGLR